MAKFLVIFVAFCLAQALARPSADSETHLKALGKEISTLGETLNKELSKVIELPDAKHAEEINKKLEHGVVEVADAMTKVAQVITKEVQAHSPEAEKMFKEMQEKFEKEVDKIKKEHPKESAQVKEYQKQVEEMYNKVATDSKKVIEKIQKDTEGVRGDFEKGFENFANFLKTNMESMGKTLKAELEKHQKEH